MRQLLSDSDDSGEPGFHKIVDGFLLQPGLPFAGVLSSEKMNRIFRKHGGLFGGSGIYNTAIVLWAFLGQVLHNGKEASCQAAVAGIISFCLQVERDAPTEDTGDYCRARTRLSANSALRSPTRPNNRQTPRGCGNDVMRNSLMVSPSRCPIRKRIRPSFLTRELR